MTRTWLSRVARLLTTAKKPASHGRLAVEALEDRSVPASYTFDATANTLLITLATDESLTVTAGPTDTTFTLGGGSGSPAFTRNGGDPASGSGGGTISVANTDLTTSLTVNNAGAADNSNNDVTFAGGGLTSGAITVDLTDADGGSDRDDVTLGGGAALTGQTALSTQNGSVLVGVGTAVNATAGSNTSSDLALTAGLALTINGALTTSGSGTITLTVDPPAADVNPSVGGTVTVSPTATITSGVAVQITGGNQDDTFDLTSQTGAALSVGGGPASTASPGDTLIVRGSVNTFAPAGPGAGTYTFNNGGRPIAFTGVETVVAAGATVGATATAGAEGGADGGVTFTRAGNTSQPLTVNFSLGSGSTATFGTDYTLSAAPGTTFTFNQGTGAGTATFAAGSATAVLTVNVTDDSTNEPTETVIVNVGASAQDLYTVSPTAGTATVSIADNDPNGNTNANGPGNDNGTSGTPARKRPAFSGAQVVGDRMVLFGPDGEVKAAVPVAPGTLVAFSDLNGDGNGDIVTISPLLSAVIDGLTGNVLAVFADFDGDRVRDILLYNPDTGAPSMVFLSRAGRSFPLS